MYILILAQTYDYGEYFIQCYVLIFQQWNADRIHLIFLFLYHLHLSLDPQLSLFTELLPYSKF